MLTPQQLQQWKDDGYLLLRDVIPRETIEGMRRVYAGVVEGMLNDLKAKGVIADTRPELPLETSFAKAAGKEAGRFGRSWRSAIFSPELYELHRSPRLVDAVRELMGGAEVLGHPVWNARPKLPSQQLTVVPWHQDSSYFGAASDKSLILTVWIPLVKTTTANGALQVLPGSHKLGLVPHHQETREGAFLEVSNAVDESKAVTCEMEMGDALVFDNLMFHQSLPNTTEVVRWSVDIRYYRAGDWIGAIDWPDKGWDWVVRSDKRAETSLAEWTEHAKKMR